MATVESPQRFTKILTRQLPKTVQAQRCVFLYDNSYNMLKHALRKGSREILNFKIFSDKIRSLQSVQVFHLLIMGGGAVQAHRENVKTTTHKFS